MSTMLTSLVNSLLTRRDHIMEGVIFLGIFFTVRIISLLLQPFSLFQSLFGLSIVALTTWLFLRKPAWGMIVILGELLLGGSGHLFEIFGLSLRTLLLCVGICFVFFHSTWRPTRVKLPKLLATALLFLGIWILFSVGNALIHNHNFHLIYADTIPFLYLLFIGPIQALWHDKKVQQTVTRLLLAALVGQVLWISGTEFLFATGAELLQGPYYKFFRDVFMGKITDMQNGFFRITLPEHLLLIPALLLSVGHIIKEKWKPARALPILFGLLLVLAINFSRTLYITLFGGLFILMILAPKLKTFFTAISIVFASIVCFLGINIIASGGQSNGLELISNRFGGIIRPNTETSAYTRKSLLTPISEKIQSSPIIGHGLGATITVRDMDGDELQTPQFDWGWFELTVEMGLIGTGIILFILLSLFSTFYKHKKIPFSYGGTGVITALCIMTLFMPALFHVYGVVMLTTLLAYRTTV